MAKGGIRKAGNVNMRGRKFRMMGCRCCECIDLRDKLRAAEAVREMRCEGDP